jgi:hypothetical protein
MIFKKELEKYCPPLEGLPAETECRRGVNFELYTHSGFRGRMYAVFHAMIPGIISLLVFFARIIK